MQGNAIYRIVITLLGSTLLAVLATNIMFYHTQKQELMRRAEVHLETVARLKMEQISVWRAELLGDSAVLSASPLFIEGVGEWLASPSVEGAKPILTRLTAIHDHYHYDDVLLVDLTGEVRMRFGGDPGTLHPELKQGLDKAFLQRQPQFCNLHINMDSTGVYVSVIAPLFASNDATSALVGAIILQCDAKRFLFPMVQSWPTPSPSAETMLVCRDGDDVLLLNELRRQEGTALALRIPLVRADVPMVMAIQGRQGEAQGRDYRGVPVVAYLAPIPDTPWYIVTEMGMAEVYSDWELLARRIVVISLLLAILAGLATGAALLWQQSKFKLGQSLLLARQELWTSEERHRMTLMSIGDAVIITDTSCRIEAMNPVAESLTGWPQTKATGRPLEEVFHIIDEETREVAENPAQKVLRSGIIASMTNHTILIAQDGTERFITDSSAPILTEEGTIAGVVLVFHDQSEEHAAQRALQQSANFTRAVLDGLSAHIAIVDAEGRIEAVNHAWRAFAEANPPINGNVCEGADYFAVCEASQPPDDIIARMATTAIREVLSGRSESFSMEYPCHSPEKQRWFLEHITRFPGDGAPRVIVAHENITERKLAEDALRESEARFRELADNIKDVFWICTPDISRIFYISLAFEGIWGLPCQSVYDNPLLLMDSIHEDDRDRVQATLESFEQGTCSFEYRIVQPGGGIRWIYARSFPVYDDTGQIVRIVGIAVDITDRKQAELERERLMTAIEQSAEAVIITGADGCIQYVNPAFERVTGYSHREVIAKNPRILKSGTQDATFYRELWNTLSGGDTWSGRLVNKRKDGTQYTVEATISPVRDASGQIVNYVAVHRDITQRLLLENQIRHSQKMDAIGQLAGGVAHDFNNILQVLMGYSQLLLDQFQADDKARADLEIIHHGIEKATVLTRQLLLFSRQEAMEPVNLSLNSVIENLLKMLRRIIGEDIRVEWLPGNRLGVVHADTGMMEQVLMNLCVNARDAMEQGGTLTIETQNILIDSEYCANHVWASPGPYALLSVTDTGCGIDKEMIEHLFEPFFTTKEPGKGTGLGLATVYGIVKQHGGMVDCYSEPGKGTIFKVYLPFCERQAMTVGPLVKGEIIGGNETILMAEDDEALLNLGMRILGSAGYTVLQAADGKEALDVFEKHAGDIDLILLDVVMPKMGGKAVYETLHPQHPRLRFLFASGYSSNALRTGFMLSEGVELIQKPYKTYELLHKVRQVLDMEPGEGNME